MIVNGVEIKAAVCSAFERSGVFTKHPIAPECLKLSGRPGKARTDAVIMWAVSQAITQVPLRTKFYLLIYLLLYSFLLIFIFCLGH